MKILTKKICGKIFAILMSSLVFLISFTAILRIEKTNGINFDSTMEFENRFVQEITVQNEANVKIAIMTDLHLTYLFSTAKKNTFSAMDKYFEANECDLVVLTGDVVWSLFNDDILREVANFFEEKQIYWAYILGNHDGQFGMSKSALFNSIKDYNYSLACDGYSNLGFGNYFVNLKNNSGDIIHTLTLLDSSTNTVSDLQGDWYKWCIDNTAITAPNAQNTVFLHIPFPQVATAVMENNYSGEKRENVCPLASEGIFDEITALGKTKYVFNGHDHTNEYQVTLEGVNFKNCLSSGYCAYGASALKGITMYQINTITNEYVLDYTFYSDLN